MDRLGRLHDAGVSIWLDTLSRDLLETGAFAELVDRYRVTGATTNPTIFATAITTSERYDEQLRALTETGVRDARELFVALASEDVRRAAALLRPVYDRTSGRDGFVSFECTPDVGSSAGAAVDHVASVASFFVSRLDAKAQSMLLEGSPLRGRIAVANAHCAYGAYLARFAGPRWEALEARGATRQRPLWASTGTKDPTFSDVLYVESLIAPGVVNTMPEKTLRAFADHGDVRRALDADIREADAVLVEATTDGLDLAELARALERSGLQAFADSYDELLTCIGSKLARVAPSHA